MNIQRCKVNLQPDMLIFHPGSVFGRMPLERKLPIITQGNPPLWLTGKARKKAK